MTTELPNFKKFVSEDEIAEAKKKRQEEWEKVRRPDEPEGLFAELCQQYFKNCLCVYLRTEKLFSAAAVVVD